MSSEINRRYEEFKRKQVGANGQSAYVQKKDRETPSPIGINVTKNNPVDRSAAILQGGQIVERKQFEQERKVQLKQYADEKRSYLKQVSNLQSSGYERTSTRDAEGREVWVKRAQQNAADISSSTPKAAKKEYSVTEQLKRGFIDYPVSGFTDLGHAAEDAAAKKSSDSKIFSLGVPSQRAPSQAGKVEKVLNIDKETPAVGPIKSLITLGSLGLAQLMGDREGAKRAKAEFGRTSEGIKSRPIEYASAGLGDVADLGASAVSFALRGGSKAAKAGLSGLENTVKKGSEKTLGLGKAYADLGASATEKTVRIPTYSDDLLTGHRIVNGSPRAPRNADRNVFGVGGNGGNLGGPSKGGFGGFGDKTDNLLTGKRIIDGSDLAPKNADRNIGLLDGGTSASGGGSKPSPFGPKPNDIKSINLDNILAGGKKAGKDTPTFPIKGREFDDTVGGFGNSALEMSNKKRPPTDPSGGFKDSDSKGGSGSIEVGGGLLQVQKSETITKQATTTQEPIIDYSRTFTTSSSASMTDDVIGTTTTSESATKEAEELFKAQEFKSKKERKLEDKILDVKEKSDTDSMFAFDKDAKTLRKQKGYDALDSQTTKVKEKVLEGGVSPLFSFNTKPTTAGKSILDQPVKPRTDNPTSTRPIFDIPTSTKLDIPFPTKTKIDTPNDPFKQLTEPSGQRTGPRSRMFMDFPNPKSSVSVFGKGGYLGSTKGRNLSVVNPFGKGLNINASGKQPKLNFSALSGGKAPKGGVFGGSIVGGASRGKGRSKSLSVFGGGLGGKGLVFGGSKSKRGRSSSVWS